MIPGSESMYRTYYVGPVLEIGLEKDDVMVPVLLDGMPVIAEEDEESAETGEDLPPSYEAAMGSFERHNNPPSGNVFQQQDITTHALCNTAHTASKSAWAPVAHVGQVH